MKEYEMEEFFNKAHNRNSGVGVTRNSGDRVMCPTGHKNRGYGRLVNAVKDFYDMLCDLGATVTYWEAWVPILTACSVVAIWLFFAYVHAIPNPYRSILLWLLFFILVCGVAILNPEGRAG